MYYLQPVSGLHLLLQPADRNRIDLEFTYTAGGSWFEQNGDRGKRHLLEHCLVSRTKIMNFSQVKDYCFKENIASNAYTSTLTMSLVGHSHRDDFNKLVDLFSEFFFEPTFCQEDLDREKEIVLREISERRGDPNYILYYDTVKQIFTPESLDPHEPLGNTEEVASTSLEDFHRLHRQILDDGDLILKLSGGFEHSQAEDYFKQKIIDLGSQTPSQNKKYPINFLPKNTFQDFTNRAYTHPLGHEHAEVTVFIPCPVNFENKPIAAIFEQLYFRYGGILYDKLRDDLGLVYGLSGTFRQSTQALEIELSCEIQHIRKILEEITQVFSNFDQNFKADKFKQMKDRIRKQKDLAMDNPKFLVDFTEQRLLNYGIFEEYHDYGNKIQQASQDEIRELYLELQTNLARKKVIVVSKNPAIESANIFV